MGAEVLETISKDREEGKEERIVIGKVEGNDATSQFISTLMSCGPIDEIAEKSQMSIEQFGGAYCEVECCVEGIIDVINNL